MHKGSVVVVRPDACEDWLSCRSTDEARSFLQLKPPEEMHAEPFPSPPWASKRKPTDARQNHYSTDPHRTGETHPALNSRERFTFLSRVPKPFLTAI